MLSEKEFLEYQSTVDSWPWDDYEEFLLDCYLAQADAEECILFV